MNRQERRLYYIKMQLMNIHESYNQDMDSEEYKEHGEEDFNCFLELFKESNAQNETEKKAEENLSKMARGEFENA